LPSPLEFSSRRALASRASIAYARVCANPAGSPQERDMAKISEGGGTRIELAAFNNIA
jgi:hypothetical protein